MMTGDLCRRGSVDSLLAEMVLDLFPPWAGRLQILLPNRCKRVARSDIHWVMPQQSGSETRLGAFNRRRFLKTAGTAAILPAVLPAYALQGAGSSANNR